MVFNMVERKKKCMSDQSSGIRKTLNSNNAALAHTRTDNPVKYIPGINSSIVNKDFHLTTGK